MPTVFACKLCSLSIMDFLQSRPPLPMIQCLSCLPLETSLVIFDCNLCAFKFHFFLLMGKGFILQCLLTMPSRMLS